MVKVGYFLLLLFSVVASDPCGHESQHPVLFVSGLMGSILETSLDIPKTTPDLPHSSCARNTSSNWHQTWVKIAEFLPKEFDCLCYYLSPSWANPRNPQNKQGVKIRVPSFGSVYALDRLDPDDIITAMTNYYHLAIEALRDHGFEEHKTYFGAAFDWRFLPQQSWIDETKQLVENAVQLNNGKKVVFVSHSMGCMNVYAFLMSQTKEWRQKHVGLWIAASPVTTGTPFALYAMLARDFFGLPGIFAKIGTISHLLPSMYGLLPNENYGDDLVIAKTPTKVYTQNNISDLLECAGINIAKTAINAAREALGGKTQWKHPEIPTSFVLSFGWKTISGIKYNKDSDIGKNPPEPLFSDGDGLVPAHSLRYLYDLWSSDPETAPLTTALIYPKMFHGTVPNDKQFLEFLKSAACYNTNISKTIN